MDKSAVDLETKESVFIYTGECLMTQSDLLERLAISRRTFTELNDPDSEYYDPDFPKPCNLFTGRKYRYSSIDVDNYIRKISHSTKAA